MTGRFRGAKIASDHFETVEGCGCLFMDSKAYIIKSAAPTLGQTVRVQVVPASVSPSVFLQGVGHVFRGDIIRYTFKERKEYFNRYYEVVEHNNVIKLMELYRDYVVDDDLSVVRGKFKTNAGEHRDILAPTRYDETYTLIGNTWDNPELGR